uniref:Uncharacterized protein n=1 Tax=Rhizophora mucronata TaxID=61149 RepID=A0A2P2NNS6_RHIMU
MFSAWPIGAEFEFVYIELIIYICFVLFTVILCFS